MSKLIRIDDKYKNWISSIGTRYGFFNSNFELINKGNPKINGYSSCCCIRFDDFDIIAETSSDGNCNPKLDPTETEYTTYFDIDGNVIENVYEYISQHGAKPEDGMSAEEKNDQINKR